MSLTDRLRHNLSLKLISLVVAFIIWGTVHNQADPLLMRQEQVSVEVVRVPAGLAVATVEPPQVAVTLYGRRSLFERLAYSEARLVADLSGAGIGTVTVSVQPRDFPAGLEVKHLANRMVKVTLDALVTRSRPVAVEVHGAAAPGFAVSESSVHPAAATLSGPSAEVGKVTRILASVDVAGRSETTQVNVELMALDADGSPVGAVQVQPAQATVTLQVRPVNRRSVPVAPVVGKLPAGYEVAEVTAQPDTVSIAGPTAKIAAVEAVQTAPVDVADAAAHEPISVPLEAPEGATLVGTTSVAVTVRLRKAGAENGGSPPATPQAPKPEGGPVSAPAPPTANQPTPAEPPPAAAPKANPAPATQP